MPDHAPAACPIALSAIACPAACPFASRYASPVALIALFIVACVLLLSPARAAGAEPAGASASAPGPAYAQQVMMMVRDHWEFPALTSPQPLTVRVRARVTPNGQIWDFNVEQSSGQADFDASALKALGKVGMLPPPPGPEYQDLLLTFNLQEMIGKR
ncbi:energy transducer TonB [Nitratidesulfovibrio sp. SRB-5]|uniref:energy transducer TonB n=1 Tax=Nitratidesulfovibrio sp. SRB-5 TaxID=2872636 RepID=UPI00102824CF|nr:energy transducer TonB [Nitratidesulfovibrio sp. SRB-5]MBZ2170526.1 TonB family protein [Nitratidesulfovibrio sp. SRB-5]RXF76803.1 TonB family protein [Desulfovibrio sp. DS-1]